MSKEDFYKVLGVNRSATDDEIKKAYRKLAVKYHPDKNPGNKSAEESFKKASEAYETLKNPEKKQQYDQFGASGNPFGQGFGGNRSGGFHSQGSGDFESGEFTDIFSDLFSDSFGRSGRTQTGPRGRRRQAPPQKGSDLRYNLNITLEEATEGTKKTIHYIRLRGAREDTAKLSVTVPPGIKNGQKLKLTGEGDSSPNNGSNGDLYVIIGLQRHSLFKQEGFDILLDLPISIIDACLGCKKTIPTLTGKIELQIPKGTTSGKIFRLRAKGAKNIKTKKNGDMMIKIIVDVPTSLNKKDEELLQKINIKEDDLDLVSEFNQKMEQHLENNKTKK